MTEQEKNKWTLYILGLIIMIVFLLSSCKTIEYVPVEKVVTKDSLVVKKEIDSVYVKVKEFVNGDTIYRDSIVFRYILRCDTFYVHTTDSVEVFKEVEVVKEVEKKLNSYQKTMIGLGWALIALLVGIVGWRVVKWYLRLKGC